MLRKRGTFICKISRIDVKYSGRDGRIKLTGKFKELKAARGWTDIKYVEPYFTGMIGVKKDGSVIVDYEEKGISACNETNKNKIESWKNIDRVWNKNGMIVAVDMNGRTYLCTYTDYREYENVVTIIYQNGINHILGMDGKVYSDFLDSNWENVVAIFGNMNTLIGICRDGKILCHEAKLFDRTDFRKFDNMKNWKLFDDINTVKKKREAYRTNAIEEAEKKKQELELQKKNRIAILENEKQELMTELSELTGLFKGGQRKKIQEKIENIEKEIKSIQKKAN